MDLDVTVVTRTIEGVELGTTQTLLKECSVPCLDFGSRFTVPNCTPSLERWKNAHHMKWDCKGAVKAVQALQTGRRQPKGRNRDLEVGLELRVKNALLPGQRI
eukprot:2505506-Amphidinium_carterae.1